MRGFAAAPLALVVGCGGATVDPGVEVGEVVCPSVCVHENELHAAGTTFLARDGCNTCNCGPDGHAVCTKEPCDIGCVFGGRHYAPGDAVFSPDCNACACQGHGDGVICTEVLCDPVCVVAGETHQVGESYRTIDGCNTCGCSGTGIDDCTLVGCSCEPDQEWWRHYVARTTDECPALPFACPRNTWAFSNECGAGCEQSHECAPVIECTTSYCAQAAERCPYSQIMPE